VQLAAIIEQRRAIESPRARRRRPRPRPRRIRPTRGAAAETARVARSIQALSEPITRALIERIFPLLREREGEFLVDSASGIVTDRLVDELLAELDRIKREHVDLAEQRARVVAEDMTRRTNEAHRRRFYSSIEATVGIDLAGIVAEEGLQDTLTLKTRENVGLIKTIPETYFQKIETRLLEGVVQGRMPARSLIEELRELGNVTKRRARFIARDQTAKLNAAMNRERNQALGIEEYVWRTSKDERVRESHAKRDGKRFRWDDPPAGGPAEGGHPGEAINCRCTAEPVIVL
jgi:SPP1 gp7 family putative phage head morphogenesis protein